MFQKVFPHLSVGFDKVDEVVRLWFTIKRTMLFVRKDPNGRGYQSFDVILIGIHQKTCKGLLVIPVATNIGQQDDPVFLSFRYGLQLCRWGLNEYEIGQQDGDKERKSL